MKVQEFAHTAASAHQAFDNLREEIQDFIKEGDKVIALSHAIVEDDGNWIATALLCYEHE